MDFDYWVTCVDDQVICLRRKLLVKDDQAWIVGQKTILLERDFWYNRPQWLSKKFNKELTSEKIQVDHCWSDIWQLKIQQEVGNGKD